MQHFIFVCVLLSISNMSSPVFCRVKAGESGEGEWVCWSYLYCVPRVGH